MYIVNIESNEYVLKFLENLLEVQSIGYYTNIICLHTSTLLYPLLPELFPNGFRNLKLGTHLVDFVPIVSFSNGATTDPVTRGVICGLRILFQYIFDRGFFKSSNNLKQIQNCDIYTKKGIFHLSSGSRYRYKKY